MLHHYSQLLLAVAYLLPPDVHRFVEEETQRVNLAILANRRSYTQLCSHLMTGEEGGREGGGRESGGKQGRREKGREKWRWGQTNRWRECSSFTLTLLQLTS